jgi:uncharacterized membrane protein YdjX (TVP38/TMEM64 family)
MFRALLVLLLLIAVIAAAAIFPLGQVISNLEQWIEHHETLAVFAVTALVAVSILLLLPLSPMSIFAGFVFGLAQGFLVVWIAGMVASTLAFWIGRGIARPWVERKIRRKTTFMAIDRAIERKGFLVVLLLRLVMVVPYQWLNYALGLTNVSLKDYLLGTNIGMILPFFLFVYLGTTVSDFASVMSGDVSFERHELALGIVALLAVISIIVLIIRKATVILREELAGADAGEIH